MYRENHKIFKKLCYCAHRYVGVPFCILGAVKLITNWNSDNAWDNPELMNVDTMLGEEDGELEKEKVVNLSVGMDLKRTDMNKDNMAIEGNMSGKSVGIDSIKREVESSAKGGWDV